MARLMKPVQCSEFECWQCEYRLAGFRVWGRPIYGEDSWQALQLAIRIVGAELSSLWPRLFYQGEPVDPKSLVGTPPVK